MISVLLVLSSFAALAEAQTPAWAGAVDTSISVSGLQVGDTVKFYQVLEYDQTAKTTGGWKFTTAFAGLTPDNLNQILGLGDYATGKTKAAQAGITAALAGDIASQITSTTAVSYIKENIAATTASQENPAAGLYVAIITPANGTNTVYNPVFVGADYYTNTDPNHANTWAVTANMTYADNAMAKKDTIEVTKTATEKAEDSNETNNAKAVAKGDWINFEINTNIPLFADNYTAPLFVVTDTMTSGLAYNKTSVHVYESDGTTEIEATKDSKTQFTLDTTSNTQYKITFDPDYLKSLTASKPIVIKYEAQVTEDAVENVHEEDNTVTVEYSHKPDVTEEGQGKKLRDKTHHYTFTIDGNIWGDSSRKTTEVVKVGIDAEGNEIEQTTTLASSYTIGALAGAEFKLYTTDPANGNPTEYNKGAYLAGGKKIVSDSEGRLTVDGTTNGIPGLDAGTYWLVETKAPAGYIKQEAPVKIEIIPTYYDEFTFTDADGLAVKTDDVMKSYVVKIDTITTAEYVLHYDYKDGKTEADADRVPSSDIAKEDTNDMKTTAGDVVIGNSGPITIVENEKQESDAYGKIQNVQGVELPSTGGMGTTILYIGGSILVILAAVLLITKRRMNAED